MTYNTGERKDIRKAEKVARLADLNRGEVIRSIMSTAPGREWVWARLEAAHVFRPSFSFDPYATAFAEGERNQGLLLLNDLMQWCPDEFVLAMREYNVRRDSKSASDSAPGERSGSESNGRDDQGSGDADDDAGSDYVHPLNA